MYSLDCFGRLWVLCCLSVIFMSEMPSIFPPLCFLAASCLVFSESFGVFFVCLFLPNWDLQYLTHLFILYNITIKICTFSFYVFTSRLHLFEYFERRKKYFCIYMCVMRFVCFFVCVLYTHLWWDKYVWYLHMCTFDYVSMKAHGLMYVFT